MSEASLYPTCPSCGMQTLHPGEVEGWTCWNCGAVPKRLGELPSKVSTGVNYPCLWCGRTETHLVSEPGRTDRGVWQVLHCEGCGATHAQYAPSRGISPEG